MKTVKNFRWYYCIDRPPIVAITLGPHLVGMDEAKGGKRNAKIVQSSSFLSFKSGLRSDPPLSAINEIRNQSADRLLDRESSKSHTYFQSVKLR